MIVGSERKTDFAMRPRAIADGYCFACAVLSNLVGDGAQKPNPVFRGFSLLEKQVSGLCVEPRLGSDKLHLDLARVGVGSYQVIMFQLVAVAVVDKVDPGVDTLHPDSAELAHPSPPPAGIVPQQVVAMACEQVLTGGPGSEICTLQQHGDRGLACLSELHSSATVDPQFSSQCATGQTALQVRFEM